ncbi:MAG TPA: hypothetical protein VK530_11315 [Candidatus Acidoferrum sp.]|nr:hypothetical protein [Candidatus Acidoferrum sp.]
MDAGRLHEVLETIRQDYGRNLIPDKLGTLVDALTASISTTTEANAVAFRDALADFYAALDHSPFRSAVPSQMVIVKEMDASARLADGLRERVQQILDSNNVTPANALTKLNSVLSDVRQFDALIEQTVVGFEELHLPYDTVRAGETEIGALVPWEIMNRSLEGLEDELHEFDKALKIFGELVEDNPESPKVSTIASSKLQIFLESTPAIALRVATALERLCALYKQILEIKALRRQLGDKAVPEKVTASLEAHEQQMASKEIDKIANDLVKQFGKQRESGRKNELRVGVRAALKFFATQIDLGVDMEVRSEPPKAEAPVEGAAEVAPNPKATRALEEARNVSIRIKNAGAAMRSLTRAEGSILTLDQPASVEVKGKSEDEGEGKAAGTA